jgi:hypothetical protein
MKQCQIFAQLTLWEPPCGRPWSGSPAPSTPPVTLDGVDTLELAELLAFTADALGWRSADVIRSDLAAHLRRWATRLHPSSG